MSDPIHDRGSKLENLFFKQRDEVLLEQLKAAKQAQQDRHDLSVVSGVDDEQAIAALVEVGVTADSMTSSVILA